MAIINGKFETDLSGWNPSIISDADSIWDNGRARVSDVRCKNESEFCYRWKFSFI